MINNVKSYDAQTFKKSFEQTAIYQQLTRDFDELSFDKFFVPPDDKFATPRQFFGDRQLLRSRTKFSVIPFYYLNYLLDKQPGTIVDLGCGWNVFKKYIPNIVGIGPEDDQTYKFADIKDCVDRDFVSNHRDSFDCVFSINALHFRPITDFADIVKDFVSMLKGGARGFITFNWALMLDFTPNYVKRQIWNYEEYIRSALSDIECKWIVVDVDLSRLDDPMDGNIRLVMEKY